MSYLFCYEEKFRSPSNEEIDPLYCEEKFWSASKEDAYPFYCEKKFRSTSKEDASQFYFEEKELITCRALKIRNRLHQWTYFHKLN